MQITISKDYTAYPDNDLLGYLGETNARVIEIDQPEVEGADTYRLRFEYSDKVVYDMPIADSRVIVTGSLLREIGDIKCQWIAIKSDGDNYTLVAKSNVFTLSIGNSISDDIAPIPTYEQSIEALDKVLKTEANCKDYAEQAEQFKYDAMSFKDVAKEQAGIAKTATAQAKVYAENCEYAANIATQKADELTAIVNDLNNALEARLNGGVDNG